MPHTLVFFKGTFILLHMTEITQSVLVQTLPLVGSGPHQPANLVWLSIICPWDPVALKRDTVEPDLAMAALSCFRILFLRN